MEPASTPRNSIVEILRGNIIKSILAIIGVVVALFAVTLKLYPSLLSAAVAEADISVKCVNIHLRKNKQNDTKLIYAADKLIADMGFRNCHITWEENNKPRHLSVDFFSDSAKMKNEANRLATRAREDLPPEFREILASREYTDDPKWEEKDKLGLYLMP